MNVLDAMQAAAALMPHPSEFVTALHLFPADAYRLSHLLGTWGKAPYARNPFAHRFALEVMPDQEVATGLLEIHYADGHTETVTLI